MSQFEFNTYTAEQIRDYCEVTERENDERAAAIKANLIRNIRDNDFRGMDEMAALITSAQRWAGIVAGIGDAADVHEMLARMEDDGETATLAEFQNGLIWNG